jgi:hypothetical protein
MRPFTSNFWFSIPDEVHVRPPMLRPLHRLCTAIVALSVFSPTAAEVSNVPFVFVEDKVDKSGLGLAWWAQGAMIRPMGKQVSGVTLKRLSEKLNDGAWCYADAFSPASFVSASRRVQAEIDSTMREARSPLFKVSGPFTGGADLDAVVGTYEGCNGTVGNFVLITDRTQPQPNVVFLQPFPRWRGLAWIRYEEDGLTIGSCFECGHADRLLYDKARSRFYWLEEVD